MKKNNFWKRFFRSLPAVIGIGFILFCFVLTVLASYIIPDKTIHANRQTIEIQNMLPGHRQLFITIDGSELPINSYKVFSDSIHLEKYVDEGVIEIRSIPIDEKTKISIFERTYLLGTDGLGRDILSRLILGTRISLATGLTAALVSLIVGLLLGMLAGYYRGITDAVISWFIQLNWAIPTLLLVFAITLLMGKGLGSIMLAIGLSMWVNVARLVRGQVMAVKEMEYIQAARMLGFSNARIMFRHILPNISGPLIVITVANFATAIMLESGLSFLGIGLQPPMPSWGLMVRENYDLIITGKPLLAFIPGIAIALLVFSLNLTGNGIRDALDVKS